MNTLADILIGFSVGLLLWTISNLIYLILV